MDLADEVFGAAKCGAAVRIVCIRHSARDDVYKAILNHQDFQGKHYYGHFGAPTDLRYTKYDQTESWWALCAEFTDDWDQQAFDPDADGMIPARSWADQRAFWARASNT